MIEEPHVVGPEPGLAQTLLAVLAANWAGALAGAFVLTAAGEGPLATTAKLAAGTAAGALVLPSLVRVLAGAVVPGTSALAALLAGNAAAFGSRALLPASAADDSSGLPSLASLSSFLVAVAVSLWLVRAAAEPAPRRHPLVLSRQPSRATFGWLSIALAVAIAILGIGALSERGLSLRPPSHAYEDQVAGAQAAALGAFRLAAHGSTVRPARATLADEISTLDDGTAPPPAERANAELVRALRKLADDLPAIAAVPRRERVKALLPDWQRVHAAFAHLDRLGYADLETKRWSALLKP